MFRTWPVVAFGQFMIALNWAELSSHYPVAGSVFQWTKYLANRTYAWFTGWMYLFAGILTVTSVCVTLPLALIPAFNGMGWNLSNSLHNQRIVAVITLGSITVLNIFGVRLVALINNTGVIFEILGMVVFALILAFAHNTNGFGVIFNSSFAGNFAEFPAKTTVPFFLLLLFLVGVGPLLSWRRSSAQQVRRRVIVPASAGSVVMVTLAALGMRNVAALAAYGLASFVLVANVQEIVRGVRSFGRATFKRSNKFLALRRLARSGAATIRISSAPIRARLVHPDH